MGFTPNTGECPAGVSKVDVLLSDGRIGFGMTAALLTWVTELGGATLVAWRPAAGSMEAPEEKKPTGGSNSYYVVQVITPTTPGVAPYEAECNDIIEALGMTFAEGNVFKALWRSCAARTLGKVKPGMDGDGVYDAEKMVFFSARVLSMRKEGK